MFVHFGPVLVAGAPRVGDEPGEDGPGATTSGTSGTSTPTSTIPREWARAAAEAGMRYVVLTTKHHEGFCLWDSALTDYSVMATPYGKDLIGAVRRGGARRRAQGRLLSLPARLASSRLRRRRLPSTAKTASDVAALNAGEGREPISRVPPRPGPRAADPLRQDRLPLHGLLLRGRHDPRVVRPARQGTGLLGVRGAPRHGPGAAAGHRRQRSARHPGRLRHARAVPAGRSHVRQTASRSCGRRARPSTAAGATTATTWTTSRSTCWSGCSWTGSPRTATCCSTSVPRRAAASIRGRSPPSEASATGCGCTAGRSTAPVRPSSRRRRTPATRSAATASTSICSPGRSSTCTCRAWPAGSSTPSCSTTRRRSASSRCRRARRRALIHPGGQPEGTLTLKLPVQRPDVALPVVELFLAPGS